MRASPTATLYYLAGLLVCRGGEAEYESFWADDATGEAAMWSALVERLAAFPDAPRLPLRQLREEGVRHAGEAAR